MTSITASSDITTFTQSPPRQKLPFSKPTIDFINRFFEGSLYDKSQLKGGNVGTVYLLSKSEKNLVVKKFANQNEKWLREFIMCRWAGEHSIGPAIYLIDEAAGEVIMEYAQEGPLSPPYAQWIDTLAEKLRNMHALPFPEAFSDINRSSSFEIFHKEWSMLRTKMAIPTCMQAMFHQVNILENLFTNANQKLVICHNDTHPQNILTSQNIPLFVDWSLAGPDYAMIELAGIAMHLQLDESNELMLLQSYFQGNFSAEQQSLYQSAKAIPYLLKINFPLLSLNTSQHSADDIDAVWDKKSFPTYSYYLNELASGNLNSILRTDIDYIHFSLSFLDGFYAQHRKPC